MAEATKPGWKTSEFWLSLAVVVLGALLASGALSDGGLAAKIVGAGLQVLAALGYTASRTSVKKADAKGPTPTWVSDDSSGA